MNHPLQDSQEQQFMAEAARAAEQINFNTHGGTVYGAAPEQTVEQKFNEQVYTVPAAEAIGRATGAAVVGTEAEAKDRYVDPAQRGMLHAQYANHAHIRQQAEQNDAFVRARQNEKSDDDELVNA